MKKFAIALVILAMAAPAFAVSTDVRISQAYGGGGSASATASFNQDYVELFNASGFDVDISGWTIEYASNTGSWGSSATNIFTFPADSWIAGCSYVLVAFGTPSAGGATLSAPDYTGNLTMSATSGKVALFNAVNTNLACGLELPGTLVDKISFGTANCPEGTNVGALSVTTAAVRNGGGTVDTDNNLADFAIVTGAMPNNSTTPPTACAPVATETESFGSIKAIFR